MQPDAAALIWDAHRAARRIQEFLAGRSLQEYRENVPTATLLG
ncbi:hypothetical protein FM103_19495 [Corynebacterium xerosis]|nr:hypothetical protein FM103_19495 [Corynebacterium xerosis]